MQICVVPQVCYLVFELIILWNGDFFQDFIPSWIHRWNKSPSHYASWRSAFLPLAFGLAAVEITSPVKSTVRPLRDTSAIPCSHSLWMKNICDSNEPFEPYAVNLCENFTERDYGGVGGALLDKHLRRGRPVPRSDLIKPSYKKASSPGVPFVFLSVFLFLSLSTQMVEERIETGKRGLEHCAFSLEWILDLIWFWSDEQNPSGVTAAGICLAFTGTQVLRQHGCVLLYSSDVTQVRVTLKKHSLSVFDRKEHKWNPRGFGFYVTGFASYSVAAYRQFVFNGTRSLRTLLQQLRLFLQAIRQLLETERGRERERGPSSFACDQTHPFGENSQNEWWSCPWGGCLWFCVR